MIPRSDFESISESASSLDYNPRSRVQGSIFAGGGDPYLRISKDTGEDMIRDGGESEGPAGESPDALKAQIRRWRKHVKDFATGAGFRKASRGSVDPRRFALHLSRIAFRHAQQYGSKSLLKISKRLRWAASQSRQAAEQELKKISNETEDRGEFPGRSEIVKPEILPVVPQWGVQRPQPRVDPKELPTQPGEMRPELPDRSWSAEQTRSGSRRRAQGGEPNEDLVAYAREFLESYRSTNSLGDANLLEELDTDDLFESWEDDLDRRGVVADDDDLGPVWQKALSEITGESSESEEGLSPGITTSRKPFDDPDDPHLPEPTSPAPGGDPMNMVLRKEDDPLKARYVDRNMHGSKKDYNWANRFLEDDSQSSMDLLARRAKSKKNDNDDDDDDECECKDKDDGKDEEIMKAVDQCLDHFAGEMVPSEISPEHVKQFIEQDFPDVSWEEVYDAIEEIADPKKRHEKDKKERTNDEYRASRPVQTTRRRLRAPTRHYVSAFDTIESTPHRRYAHLQGHRAVCACCTGTGQEGAGACSRCQGKGRHGLDLDDPQIDVKARVIKKIGSLLLVEVNPQQLAPKGRQALSRVTRTRVASGNRIRYTHSPELMRFLVGYDVPFRMVGYQHPNYRR